MRKRLVVALVSLVCIVSVGCSSINPTTGQREYDPVKTERVKAAIGPVAASAVRRVVVNNPETARYFTLVQGVVTKFRDEKKFSPEALVLALDTATVQEGWLNGLDAKSSGAATDVKNLIVGLYRINFADAGNADLSAEKFAWHLLDVLATGLGQGVVDAQAIIAAGK